MIKYEKIHKILISERFAVNFLKYGLLTSLLFILVILIFSDIEPGFPNYENLKNLITYYDFPIKIIAVTLTIFGILIVYHTYFQTKEQFIILNKAWFTSNIAFYILQKKEDENIKKAIILFEIENVGNTPAENLQVDININPSNIFDLEELNKIPKILFPKEARTFQINMGAQIFEYEKIYNSKPFFDIDIKISYSTFDDNTYKINEIYKFNYPDLPYIIFSEIYQINKSGETVKLT